MFQPSASHSSLTAIQTVGTAPVKVTFSFWISSQMSRGCGFGPAKTWLGPTITPVDGRHHGRVDKDHRVLGVVDDVGEVLGREPEVQRMEDEAAERRSPVHLEVAVAVPREGRDAVALLQTEGAEDAGEAGRPLGEVRVGVGEEGPAGDTRGDRLLSPGPAAPLGEWGLTGGEVLTWVFRS